MSPKVKADDLVVTVPDEVLDRVAGGAHHDPHSVLGMHAHGRGSVIRALLPWTISTSWPSPHPTESSATIARPVLPSAAGVVVPSSYFTLRGSTTSSFCPLRTLSF